MHAFEQCTRQPEAAHVSSAGLKRQPEDMPPRGINFQWHTWPPRAARSSRTFAQQSFTQHCLSERAYSVRRQTGAPVQLEPTQSALGPEDSENLSLTRVYHCELLY